MRTLATVALITFSIPAWSLAAARESGSPPVPSQVPSAPESAGAGACTSCHGSAVTALSSSSHGKAGVSCEQCHGPGGAHAAGSETMLGFGSKPINEANSTCLHCHEGGPALQFWRTGAHARNARCSDCHRVHAARLANRTRREENDACLGCHRKQAAEASLPYHHPMREGKMSCRDCHDPHGGSAGDNLRADHVNQLCFQCHAELEGPFMYQHPPVAESCLKCHVSHGSMNRGMTLVSQPLLCLQCHPGHHNGSGVPLVNPCTNCHSSIHGADIPSATGGSVLIDKGTNPKH